MTVVWIVHPTLKPSASLPRAGREESRRIFLRVAQYCSLVVHPNGPTAHPCSHPARLGSSLLPEVAEYYPGALSLWAAKLTHKHQQRAWTRASEGGSPARPLQGLLGAQSICTLAFPHGQAWVRKNGVRNKYHRATSWSWRKPQVGHCC